MVLPSEALTAHPPQFRLADWIALLKPRITVMVLVTAVLGALLAAGDLPEMSVLVALLVGTAMVAGGASALNQVWERNTDALMSRTAGRPLPAGRISLESALFFAVVLATTGVAILALGTNLLTAVVGAFSLLLYIFLYTPLKRRTSLATVIGAVPGALPPVMGWTAVSGSIEAGGAVLFGILFLWQLPHFLAIAWLCQQEYAAAGFPMLPVVEPDGESTGRQTVLYATALVPVSLLPVMLGLGGTIYFVGALVLGLGFLGFSVAFSVTFSRKAARRLLLASVVYLPALLVVMLVDAIV